MGHEPILTRHVLVIILILYAGSFPTALPVPGRRRCATASRATSSTGPTSSESSADITRSCSTTAVASTTWPTCPDCGCGSDRAAPGRSPSSSHRSLYESTTCARSCSSATTPPTRFGLQWRTNDQGMRDRSYSVKKPKGTFRVALVGDSIGAGWGVNAEDRFESILEESWNTRAARFRRRQGRNHQLRGARAFSRPALVSLRPDRLADGTRPGDLPVNRRRCRLGRTEAALPAGARARLGLPHLPRGARELRASSRSAARTSTSGRSSPGTGRSSPGFTSSWPPTARRAACRSSGCSFPGSDRKSDAVDQPAPDRDGSGRGFLAY